jgi:hypothetical protein
VSDDCIVCHKCDNSWDACYECACVDFNTHLLTANYCERCSEIFCDDCWEGGHCEDCGEFYCHECMIKEPMAICDDCDETFCMECFEMH